MPRYFIASDIRVDTPNWDTYASLDLHEGRYVLSGVLSPFVNYVDFDGPSAVVPMPLLNIDRSAVVFKGSIGDYVTNGTHNPPMESGLDPQSLQVSTIVVQDDSYLGIRSPLALGTIDSDSTILGTNPYAVITVQGNRNIIDLYSTIQGPRRADDDASNGLGAAIVMLSGSNILRLNAGASITRSTGISLGSSNTIAITVPLDQISLSGTVVGDYNNTFALAGNDTTSNFTFDASVLNTDSKWSNAAFESLAKTGLGTWTLTGSVPSSINLVQVEGGHLILDHLTTGQSFWVSSESGTAFDENLTPTKESIPGTLVLKNVTFTGNGGVDVDASGILSVSHTAEINNATPDRFGFGRNSALEIDNPVIEPNAAYPWLTAFLESHSRGRRLVTTAPTVLNTDLSALMLWAAHDDVTVKDVSQLPPFFFLGDQKNFILKTDFSIADLGTKAIGNDFGFTIFAGKANLDRLASNSPGASAFGTMKFQDFTDDDLTPALETDLTTEEDLNKIVSKFDQSTLAVAELTTTNGIDAGSIPAKFKVWNVVTTSDEQPHNSASALPALTNLQQGYGGINNLDVTIDKLAANQRVDVAQDTALNFRRDVTIEGQLTGSGNVYFSGANSRLSRDQDFGGTVTVWVDPLHADVTQSVLTLDNADLPNSWLDIFGSDTTAIGYIKAKEATPTLAPRLFARSASLANTLDATNDTPSSVGPGVTHLRALRVLDQLEIEALSPTLYTKIETTGDIVLGGQSKLLVYMGRFESATDLNEVLKAGGTIDGEFHSVSVNPEATSYFTLTPEYTDEHKVMNLKVNITQVPPATWQPVTRDNPENPTPEEPDEGVTLMRSAAAQFGQDNTRSLAAAMDAILTQDANHLADFGLLNGSTQADLARGLEQAMPLLAGTGNRALMDAMREMTRPMATDRCSDPTSRHTWASALGDWSRRNSAGGAMGYDANHTGIAVGGDACIEHLKHTRLGFTGAYTHTDADSRGSSADQNLKANSWMVGLYGNTPLSEAWDVDFNVNAGRSSVKGTRNLTLANRIAKSKADATLVTAGAGLNWHLMVTDKMTVTPFIRADYSRVAMDGYTETGAKGLNLSVEKQTSQSFVTRVGVKSEWALTPAWRLSATAAVGADWMDKGHEVSASFSQFPGSAFTVENDRHGRAVADLVLGTSYAITPAVTFSANAIAGVAKGTNHTAVDARVTWKF